MRKLLPVTIPVIVICCFTFSILSGQSGPLMTVPEAEGAAKDKHEFKNSVYTNSIIQYYKKSGKPKDHIVTKFDRKELIAILSNSTLDSVKFVIGAYAADESERKKKGRSVILMQVEDELQDPRKEPRGGVFRMFKYLEGSICPPPSDCSVE